MNVHPEQGVGTLHKITDPDTVARVVRLLLKFGWPPPEPADDLHTQPDDLDTAA
jgi:hypothetical protein